MDSLTVAGWCALVLFSLVHYSFANSAYGQYTISGRHDINSKHIDVKSNGIRGLDGNCRYTAVGRGVRDTLVEKCAANIRDYTMVNTDNYYAYFFPNHQPFGLYTDKRGTLVIIKSSGCTLRTYQASGQVANKDSTLSSQVCDSIKKKIADEMVKVKDYWRKWGINFDRKMKKLPPAEVIFDPLENQPPTSSLYADQRGATVTTPSTKVNPGISPQPLTPSLPAQPLAPPITAVSQVGRRTILGEASMTSNDDSVINSRSFSVYGNIIENDGGCIMKKCVKGNGVHDCFTIPCSESKPSSIAMFGFILLGHPDANFFSVFSDEPSTLSLFENGLCTKKTYTTSGGVTTSRAEFLDSDACAIAMQRMKNTLKKYGVTVTPNGAINLSFSMSDNESEDSDDNAPSTPADVNVLPPQPVAPNSNPITGEDDTSSKIIKVTTSFPPTPNGQCQVMISVGGKGVQDKFNELCSDKTVDSLSTEDVFVFGDPAKNSLSLYSNEANILYVIQNKICTKKTYTTTKGVTTSKNAPLRLIKCNEIKQTISNILKNKNPSTPESTGIALGPSTTTSNTNSDLNILNIPVDNPLAASSHAMSNGNSQSFIPAPIVSSNGPTTADTTSTTTGVSWREGKYSDIYKSQFTVNINKVGDGRCSIEVVGRGVNEKITDSCSLLGENIKTSGKSYVLAVADPTKQSGLYTEDWGELVFVREGLCYKKKYDTEYGQQTKIKTKPMSPQECREVKEDISSVMGVTFGQAQGSSSANTPTWRPGNYQSIYNARYTVTVTKNKDGPQGCTVTVTMIGRGINEEMTDSCSAMGTNIMRKTTSISLAVADPSSNSGFYTEGWGSLVVIDKGDCTYRTYDSSPVTHTTKITPKPLGKAQCDKVKGKISATLGGFGY